MVGDVRNIQVKVLIYGAGVIGQIYGGRLARAGHDVTLLARGRTFEGLCQRGIVLRTGGETCHVRPVVIREVPRDARYDVVLVTVRRDQVDAIMPAIAELSAEHVVFMLNQPGELASVARRVGTDRTIFAFPGVGGYRTDDGAIRYLEVPQQHTTVGRAGGWEQPIVDLMRSAGFPIDVAGNMEGWMKTHTVFVTAICAAILSYDGDVVGLASDRQRVATMVAAVGEGFRALAGQGVAVCPTPLRLIFTAVPRPIAVRYWQRLLRGPIGTEIMAPHVRARRDTEVVSMFADVRRLVAGRGSTPHLDELLDAVAGQSLGQDRLSAAGSPGTIGTLGHLPSAGDG